MSTYLQFLKALSENSNDVKPFIKGLTEGRVILSYTVFKKKKIKVQYLIYAWSILICPKTPDRVGSQLEECFFSFCTMI